ARRGRRVRDPAARPGEPVARAADGRLARGDGEPACGADPAAGPAVRPGWTLLRQRAGLRARPPVARHDGTGPDHGDPVVDRRAQRAADRRPAAPVAPPGTPRAGGRVRWDGEAGARRPRPDGAVRADPAGRLPGDRAARVLGRAT